MLLLMLSLTLASAIIVLLKTTPLNSFQKYCKNGVNYIDFGGDIIDTTKQHTFD